MKNNKKTIKKRIITKLIEKKMKQSLKNDKFIGLKQEIKK